MDAPPINKTNYLVPHDVLQEIFKQIHINAKLVTNVYNYGSRVHRSASPTSDYDILIVGDFKQESLKFKDVEYPYFHKYSLDTLDIADKKYDIVVYSNDNFEQLIKYQYMLVIESLFNAPEFIPINKIDYKEIYLNKYFDVGLIKFAVATELVYSLNCNKRYKNKRLPRHLDDKWVEKKLFNAIRYHDTAIELITTKNISDFTRLNNVKEIIIHMQLEGKPYEFIYGHLNNLVDTYIQLLDKAK